MTCDPHTNDASIGNGVSSDLTSTVVLKRQGAGLGIPDLIIFNNRQGVATNTDAEVLISQRVTDDRGLTFFGDQDCRVAAGDGV